MTVFLALAFAAAVAFLGGVTGYVLGETRGIRIGRSRGAPREGHDRTE